MHLHISDALFEPRFYGNGKHSLQKALSLFDKDVPCDWQKTGAEAAKSSMEYALKAILE
jgi:hypothetical protein